MATFDTDSKLVEDYKYGFSTEIETDVIAKGLNEDIIRNISARKEEPEWMLDYRLTAFKHWQTMKHPKWAFLTKYPDIDFQDISYFAAPTNPYAVDGEIDEELQKTFDKLGIPLGEQQALSGVAVDAVFDSVSIATTHRAKLAEQGIIFCSMSEAVKDHPELVKQYLGTVVPHQDNFYAALNAAVFSDGSFCYIPKGVRCPMELSTYFRINSMDTGQFERTLIIAEEDSYVSYIEGCTAPARDTNQLHAAVVEIITLENAEVKYSTVQNWFAGDENGVGGIYNFVTKRGHCRGRKSKISWTQVEVGSAITWKYPSVILEGDKSVGEFYSVAYTDHKMEADTGTKMIHIGKDTKSTIISKGISAGQSNNCYRGLVKVLPGSENSRNYSACDSLLVGGDCKANTFPYIECEESTAVIEHEASTSKISEEQMFYLRSRGLDEQDAASMIVNGFCKDVFRKLPLEFSVEAIKLLELKLEGSIG